MINKEVLLIFLIFNLHFLSSLIYLTFEIQHREQLTINSNTERLFITKVTIMILMKIMMQMTVIMVLIMIVIIIIIALGFAIIKSKNK